MNTTWGRNLQLSIFGESHGPAVGCVLSGLPSGICLDMEKVRVQMARRAPGGDTFSTTRSEPDEVKVLSGLYNGHTTGTPFCAVIENTDARPSDYKSAQMLPRPSHGDYAGFIRYKGFNDPRGGGHFSGRLTAPLCFAGAVARQWLEERGVFVGAHLAQVGDIYDASFDSVSIDEETLKTLSGSRFAVLSESAGEKMKEAISKARAEGDSLGGRIACAAVGVPAGLGQPMFDSLESSLSSLLFSVPGVKGVSFGDGFTLCSMQGSQSNDQFDIKDGRVVTLTNHAGGVNGGITNGMPLIAEVAMRPTPSIAKPQKSVDIGTMKPAELSIRGRHDPCIAVRAVAVIEAAMCLAIMDFMLDGGLNE